ncbi:hypothetical protein TL16_g09377 [Triparma laevis f. inornata]|uniref:Potassium channel domain-containing protein n=1 Tax=Triparma laevis f. inornata TaxID=1714386 RepID=A0A9W7B9K2_9STRA|nr:hypothetical protein TL16_g09377 [Triparma laevis f. inornata]
MSESHSGLKHRQGAKTKRQVVKVNNIKSKKIGKLAGKSVELKVNPLFERVGDYTKDPERRMIDVRLNFLSLFGVVLGVLQLEIAWSQKTIIIEYDDGLFGSFRGEPIKMVNYGNPIAAEVLRILGTLLTLTIIYFRFDLYKYEKERKESLWNNLITLDFVYDQRMFLKFLLEMTVMAIHPLPFCGEQVIPTCFMFCRSFLVLHIMRDFSDVYRMRKDIVTKVFDKIPSPEFNSFQSIQFQLINSPLRFLTLSAMFFWAILSYSIYAIEREYMPQEFTLKYSCWHSVTVMTTLGYDFTPSTEMGKFVTILTALAGISLETVAVVTILENLALSHYQNLALNFMEKHHSEEKEEYAAAVYVQECFRWVIYRNNQEKLRSTVKGYEHVDSAELTRKKELASQKKQARKLLEFRSARRFKQLKMMSMGEPIIDRFNGMEIKLFKELRQQSISIDKLKTALGVKRDEFDRGTKIMDFTGLQESVADNMELLKAMAPKKKHFYQKLKKKKEERAKESENDAIEEGDDEEGDEEEGGDDEISAIVKQSSEARTVVDGGNVSPKLPPMNRVVESANY